MNPLEDRARLNSGDLEKQAIALERLNAFFQETLKASVDAVIESANPVPLAERAFNFGPSILPYLRSRFERTKEDSRVILASLMTQLGDQSQTSVLLDNAKGNSAYEMLSILSLSKAGIRELEPILIEKLSAMQEAFYSDRKNAPQVCSYLMALEKLGAAFPPALRTKFTSQGVPKEISGYGYVKGED